MIGLRNVLRGTGGAAGSSGRAALQAVATRAPESTDLEKEQWVAADMEESGSPMFTDPLTIDELTSAKQDFERAFQSNAQAEPAFLSDDDATDSSASSTISVDADRQMETIHQRVVRSHAATSEYLDAALMVAADSGVQSALMNALMTNPDAQAALQRGLAMQGLSVDMQRLQQSRASLLPPAAAAVADGPPAGVEVREITDDKGGLESLKEALDKITEEVVHRLANFGGRVQNVLQAVMRRWRWRIERLLNPGKRSEIPGLEGAGRAVQVVDGIMSAAALIIVIALFKRVPLLRR